MENYLLYDEICKASGQTIHKARRKATIKYLAISCAERYKRRLISNHVRFVSVLKHPNILQFYEWYETGNHLWIVMELCTGGSLEQVVKEDGHLPENVVRKFGSDIIRGLEYIHSRGVLFNEMKPSRFLLDGGGNVKLFDFSLAHLKNETLEEALSRFDDKEECEQSYEEIDENVSVYGAPEYVNYNVVSTMSDYWGLGCLLHLMVCGFPPFDGNVTQLLEGSDTEYVVPTLAHTTISPALGSLLKSLLVKSPKHRISVTEVLKHEFWNNELKNLDSSYATESHRTTRETSSTQQQVKSLEKSAISDGSYINGERAKSNVPESQDLTTTSLAKNVQNESEPSIFTDSPSPHIPQNETASFSLHANQNPDPISAATVLCGLSDDTEGLDNSDVHGKEAMPSSRMIQSYYGKSNSAQSSGGSQPDVNATSGAKKDAKTHDEVLSSQEALTEIRADLAMAYPWGDDSNRFPNEPKLLINMWKYLLRSTTTKDDEQDWNTLSPLGNCWRPRPLNDYSRWVRVSPPSQIQGLTQVLNEAKLRSIAKEELEKHVSEVLGVFQKQSSVNVDLNATHRLWRPSSSSGAAQSSSSSLLTYLIWLIATCTTNMGRVSISNTIRQTQTINQTTLLNLTSELTTQLKSSATCSVDVRIALCQLCSLLAYRIAVVAFQHSPQPGSTDSSLPMWNAFAPVLPKCLSALTDILRESSSQSAHHLRLAAITALGEMLSCTMCLLGKTMCDSAAEKSKELSQADMLSGLWKTIVHHLLRCLTSPKDSVVSGNIRSSNVSSTKNASNPERGGEITPSNKITEHHVRKGAARVLETYVTSIIGTRIHEANDESGPLKTAVNSCIDAIATPDVVSNLWVSGIKGSAITDSNISSGQRHQLEQDITITCATALAGIIRLRPYLFTNGLIDRIDATAFTALLESQTEENPCHQTGLAGRLLSMAATGLLVPLANPSKLATQPAQRRYSFITTLAQTLLSRQSGQGTQGHGSAAAACRRLLMDQRFMAAVFQHLKSLHSVIRAKAYLVCSGILTVCPKESLPLAFDAKLPAYLERDLKVARTLQHRQFGSDPTGLLSSDMDLTDSASGVYIASCGLYFSELLVSYLIPLVCQRILTPMVNHGNGASNTRKLSRASSVNSTTRKTSIESATALTNANASVIRIWLPAFMRLPGLLSVCPSVQADLLLKNSQGSMIRGSQQLSFDFIKFLGQLLDLLTSVDPISTAAVAAGVHQPGTLENQMLGITLTITENLCREPELVQARARDCVNDILSVLARLAVAQRARTETRAICVQIISRFAEILLGGSALGDSTTSLIDDERPSSYYGERSDTEYDKTGRPLSADVNILLNELNSINVHGRTHSYGDLLSDAPSSSMTQSYYGQPSANDSGTRTSSQRGRPPGGRVLPGTFGSAVQAPNEHTLDSIIQLVNKMMICYADRLIHTSELTTPTAFIRLLIILLRAKRSSFASPSNLTPTNTHCPTPDGDCVQQTESSHSARSLVLNMGVYGLDVLLVRLLASQLLSPVDFVTTPNSKMTQGSVASGLCVSLFHLVPLLLRWPDEVKPGRLIIELHLLEITAMACVELGELLLPVSATPVDSPCHTTRRSASQCSSSPKAKCLPPRSPSKPAIRTPRINTRTASRSDPVGYPRANAVPICLALTAGLKAMNALLAYVADVVRFAIAARSAHSEHGESSAIDAEEILVASRPPPALAGWLARFIGLWRPTNHGSISTAHPMDSALDDKLRFRLCDLSITCLTHFASLYGGEYSRSALTSAAAASLSLGLLRYFEEDDILTSTATNANTDERLSNLRRRMRLILRIIRRLITSDSVCRYRLAAESMERDTTNLYTTLQFLTHKARRKDDLPTLKLITEIIHTVTPEHRVIKNLASDKQARVPTVPRPTASPHISSTVVA